MKVGVVTEIKADEYRVALTPAGARELTLHGHEVLVERGAGVGSAFADDDYEAAGATIADCDDVWQASRAAAEGQGAAGRGVSADPPGQTLFTYLHLAPAPELTRALMARARPASPTRPSRPTTAGCRCSRR